MTQNIILMMDGYKHSHHRQRPRATQYLSSYIEARKAGSLITFFGLQTLMDLWENNPITMEMIEEAAEYLDEYGTGWNREGWEHIVRAHNGRLPLLVEAVPEGTVVNSRNVVAQVINTDPECAWLSSAVETALLRAAWYPSTVASLSREIKAVIRYYMEQTCDSLDGLEYKLHDFGARGVSSSESASLGGAAHLINFNGTDTLEALPLLRRVYRADKNVGKSIPAAEHSTITAWGREWEAKAYENMIDQFGGKGRMFAIVIDSYDPKAAVAEILGGPLKEKVQNNGGTLVARPDSGDPVEMARDVILGLMDQFGCEFNSKGYKVLPPYIRVIYGDGINKDSITLILEELKKNRISADNIAFGMGGALLQSVTRDTYNWAMKASAIQVNGQWYDVYKDPQSDQSKASKRGVLALIEEEGLFHTIRKEELNGRKNHLVPVFCNGSMVNAWTFSSIRKRAM